MTTWSTGLSSMILSKSACSKVGRSIQVCWCDPEVEENKFLKISQILTNIGIHCCEIPSYVLNMPPLPLKSKQVFQDRKIFFDFLRAGVCWLIWLLLCSCRSCRPFLILGCLESLEERLLQGGQVYPGLLVRSWVRRTNSWILTIIGTDIQLLWLGT